MRREHATAQRSKGRFKISVLATATGLTVALSLWSAPTSAEPTNSELRVQGEAAGEQRTAPVDVSRRGDMDCSDFPSQRAAQIFYLNHSPGSDPHGLDDDGDGVACESNPCPCYGGSTPPGGGGGGGGHPNPPPKRIKIVKVLRGDLVTVREGKGRPYRVHLLGAHVPRNNSCFARGSLRALRSWIKPGRVVELDTDREASKRRHGDLQFDVATASTNFTLGGSQIGYGWANVDTIRFSEKRRYQRFFNEAVNERDGYWGECVKNFGSVKHPYIVGKTFDLGDWTYTFEGTDPDAWPEMQTESAYFDPPAPGWTYVRARVTVTNNSYYGGNINANNFALFRGRTAFGQFDDAYMSWCSNPNGYLDTEWVDSGDTLTGYVCATVRGPLQATDQWQVAENEDVFRRVKVQ